MKRKLGSWMWIALLVVAACSVQAQAPLPTAINYQGKLMDGTNLYSGTASVVFRIYETDDTGMEPRFEQSNDVTVVDGVYSTLIGDPDGATDWSFLDRPMEYLRLMVEINGTPLTPMERLVSVPYALLADGVKYQGINADMIANGAVNNNHMDMWSITAYNIFPGTITGAEIANQTIPLSKLAQSGAVTGQVIKYSVAGWVAADVESGGGVGVTGLVSYAESGTFIANPVASGTDSIAQGSGARALSDYSVVGGGRDNEIAAGATYGVIAGGFDNDNAGSWAAAVGGGWENNVGTNSTSAVIGGGLRNQIRDNAQQASIAGGNTNVIWGGADYASIGGGRRNTVLADAADSTIGGGDRNTVAGEGAVIGGGRLNSVFGGLATVGGGYSNLADSAYTTIGGGYETQADSFYATIGGGRDNWASGSGGTISGGSNNVARGMFNTIGGGGDCMTESHYVTIGGGYRNYATNAFATIGGGEFNTNGGISATIGGGSRNTVIDMGAVVGGGSWNRALEYHATVGGGYWNIASGRSSAVAGGEQNQATNNYSAIGGGSENVARGYAAVIPGGQGNIADGRYSFAAGYRAKANHHGAFVWGDSTFDDVASTTSNEVTFRAAGGYRLFSDSGLSAGVSLAAGGGSWISISDQNMKEEFEPVDTREVLEKVAALPMTTWKYKTQDASIRHIGPMAQDFHAAFGVGETELGITGIDADGVALAAIQALKRENDELKARLERLEAIMAGMSR